MLYYGILKGKAANRCALASFVCHSHPEGLRAFRDMEHMQHQTDPECCCTCVEMPLTRVLIAGVQADAKQRLHGEAHAIVLKRL